MTNRDVGDTDSVSGMLDGVKYDIFSMKEPMYTMKLMSPYDGLVQPHSAYEVYRHYFGVNKKEVKVKYDIFSLKEPMHTMKIMSTYAGLVQPHITYEVHYHYVGVYKKEVKARFKL